MVVCSKAAINTCCTEDRTGHYAWKHSSSNVTIGISCLDARATYCKTSGDPCSEAYKDYKAKPVPTTGTLTKQIPASIQSRFSPSTFDRPIPPPTVYRFDKPPPKPKQHGQAIQVSPFEGIDNQTPDLGQISDYHPSITPAASKYPPIKASDYKPTPPVYNQQTSNKSGMVRCSVAPVGSCCSEDRTGHPAWKYASKGSEGNIYIGKSCTDAREAFCRARGTFGSKYCPTPVKHQTNRRISGPAARVTPQTDPYRNPTSAVKTPVNAVHNFPGGSRPKPAELSQARQKLLKQIVDQRAAAEFPSGATAPSGSGGSTPRGTTTEEAPKKSMIDQICPYFSWANFLSKDCHVQIITGAAMIMVVGVVLSKVIR